MKGTVVEIPVAVGDLIDRISILEIKLERLADAEKRARVREEHALLAARRDAAVTPSAALERLAERIGRVNRTLWDIEEDLRAMERTNDFGPAFVEKARAVYITNDERARIKRRIDETTGSALSERKSYV